MFINKAALFFILFLSVS